jgi:hypothetical protein
MNVRYFFLVLGMLALVALATPTLAFAQTPDRITQLDIAVWPEFDDPRVLVQYDGTLAAQNDYPCEISFYIPTSAVLNATAYKDESQQYLNTDPPTVVDEGSGLKRVTFKVPRSNFHLEYYDDAIQGAPDKTISFVYTALLPADSVQIQVQQPLKAENFAITPASAMISEGMHDFKYHIFNYPGATADQTLKLQINYTKTDPNPSIQNVVPPETSSQTGTVDSAVPTDPQQLYVLIAAGIVLALGLLALGMWYTRRSPRLAFAGAAGRVPAGKKAEHATGFCSQCGNPMHGGDNFCPKCGAKRR